MSVKECQGVLETFIPLEFTGTVENIHIWPIWVDYLSLWIEAAIVVLKYIYLNFGLMD